MVLAITLFHIIGLQECRVSHVTDDVSSQYIYFESYLKVYAYYVFRKNFKK